jgi:hypothetical protein
VGSAEGGKEVVQHVVVRQVDHGQLRTHFVFIAVEQVVVSDGDIEEVARRNSLRIMIIVFFEGGRYLQKERLELRRVGMC